MVATMACIYNTYVFKLQEKVDLEGITCGGNHGLYIYLMYLNYRSRLEQKVLLMVATMVCIYHTYVFILQVKVGLEGITYGGNHGLYISYVFKLQEKVGVEGITYGGNHGLEILHPDGTRFNHPMPPG